MRRSQVLLHRDVLVIICDCYYLWQLFRLTSKSYYEILGDYHEANHIKCTLSRNMVMNYHEFVKYIQTITDMTWKQGDSLAKMWNAKTYSNIVYVNGGTVEFRTRDGEIVCILRTVSFIAHDTRYARTIGARNATIICYNQMYRLISYRPYDFKSSMRYIRDIIPDIYFQLLLLKPAKSSDVD